MGTHFDWGLDIEMQLVVPHIAYVWSLIDKEHQLTRYFAKNYFGKKQFPPTLEASCAWDYASAKL